MDHERKNGLMRRFIDGLALVARLALGCIFIAGSIAKLRQPYDFLGSVYNYELVGPGLGAVVAIVLPWLELFVGDMPCGRYLRNRCVSGKYCDVCDVQHSSVIRFVARP